VWRQGHENTQNPEKSKSFRIYIKAMQ